MGNKSRQQQQNTRNKLMNHPEDPAMIFSEQKHVSISLVHIYTQPAYMRYAFICHPAIIHRSETISSRAYFSFVIQSLFDIVKQIINLSLRISNPACLYFSHVCEFGEAFFTG